MATFNIGDVEVRDTTVDAIVKTVMPFMFKFRQSMQIQTGGGWTEDFFRETQALLTAAGNRTIGGVPRLSKPPEIVPEWDKLNTTLGKHITDLNIPWEDRMRSDFDAFQRALVKAAEAVSNSEDADIWTVIKADSDIQTLTLTGSPFEAWDASNADLWDNLLEAKEMMGKRPYNYPTGNLDVHVTEKDMRSIMKFITDKGATWPKVSEDTVTNANGRQGKLGVFNFIVNEALDASQAFVVVPNIWATQRVMQDLTTITTVDDLISIRIRSGLVSVPKITDPKAAVRVIGTQL